MTDQIDQPNEHTPQRVVLLDSSGILHRCFHGYFEPRVGIVDGKSVDVAGLYGYFEYVRKLAKELSYDTLVHVLDPEGGSAKRLMMFPQYKGNRSSTHPVLSAQKTLLKPLLEAFGHTCIKINGVESDDILATLAEKYADRGDEVLVITSDKDLMQIVKDGRIVLARYVDNGPGRPKTHEFYEEQDVMDKFGVRADQVADWLALVGDTSDNIPGVYKVGAKTATKWLEEYGSLASLITNAASITGASGQRLRDAIPDLPLYRQLTTVFRDVDVEIPSASLEIDPERNTWARQILSAPNVWPDDINGDLREEVTYSSVPKM